MKEVWKTMIPTSVNMDDYDVDQSKTEDDESGGGSRVLDNADDGVGVLVTTPVNHVPHGFSWIPSFFKKVYSFSRAACDCARRNSCKRVQPPNIIPLWQAARNHKIRSSRHYNYCLLER